jgi:16S rRNA (uracil1498-N3)-methyltransferase
MKALIQPSESSTILIGPEGDFSHEEIVESVNANFIPISLGKERLRTETAALVAVQNIAFINE